MNDVNKILFPMLSVKKNLFFIPNVGISTIVSAMSMMRGSTPDNSFPTTMKLYSRYQQKYLWLVIYLQRNWLAYTL